MIQEQQIVLRTHADAVAWNAGLPCAGRITDLAADGERVTVTFVLGRRPGQICGGPGQKAAAVFTVHRGKIVLWHQVPPPGESDVVDANALSHEAVLDALKFPPLVLVTVKLLDCVPPPTAAVKLRLLGEEWQVEKSNIRACGRTSS